MNRLRPLQILCGLLLLLAAAALLFHRFGTPLPDWAVRAAGVAALAVLCGSVYATVRLARPRR